jgi:hypothetical protein
VLGLNIPVQDLAGVIKGFVDPRAHLPPREGSTSSPTPPNTAGPAVMVSVGCPPVVESATATAGVSRGARRPRTAVLGPPADPASQHQAGEPRADIDGPGVARVPLVGPMVG